MSEDYRIGNIEIRGNLIRKGIVINCATKDATTFSHTEFAMDAIFPKGRLDIQIEDVPIFIKTIYKIYKYQKDQKDENR